MKVTFFGTAAAEGFPAVFCNCEFCKQARKLKGKNIRTRSQSLINDDLLIDLPADTYHHFLENDVEGDKIKYLLLTHSHQDHFYPEELNMRNGAFAHDMRAETLQVFCGEGAYKVFNETNPLNCQATLVKDFETFKCGDYEITPLTARHHAGDAAKFYVIKGEKTILYAHDTGYFYEEVFDFIKEKEFVFDMITMDCTNVDIPSGSNGAHMDIEHIVLATKRLEEMGAVTDKTVKYMNHFSHNGNPLQHVLEERVKDYGYKIAYDGCVVEI
jgi:phosphoribosyl 1,2-cyclic phosphate phosphodiesterase